MEFVFRDKGPSQLTREVTGPADPDLRAILLSRSSLRGRFFVCHTSRLCMPVMFDDDKQRPRGCWHICSRSCIAVASHLPWL